MEAAPGVSAARGVPLPISSRKEWRAVSEHAVRTSGTEQQSFDVNFGTINGALDTDILQQRLHAVLQQREELEHKESELRAQVIARSAIMGLRNKYDSQIQEHVNANVKLQEQLQERDRTIHELETKIEEVQRELHAVRVQSEAVWAKDDLLREQNKELATFRRERDNIEAERDLHLKQIHDLQDHIQEKEHLLTDLQEQHRVAQEKINFKDDQLREAQAWIARLQEMDAFQTSTNQTLQAELLDRTEQYNQLWLGCQRQFLEYSHTIQQQQMELTDLREKNGSCSEELRTSQTNLKDASHFGHSNGDDGNGKRGVSEGLPNGNTDTKSSISASVTEQTNNVPVVPVTPQSLLGMPAYLHQGQVTALHPFVMHQQGVPQSLPSHVPLPYAGQYPSVPTSSHQHLHNQQYASEGLHMPIYNSYPLPGSEQALLRPESSYGYDVSVNGQSLHPEYMDAHIKHGVGPHVVVSSSNEGGKVPESFSYVADPQKQNNLQQISSQFQNALKLDHLKHNSETEEKNVYTLSNHGVDDRRSSMEQLNSPANVFEAPSNPENVGGQNLVCNDSVTVPPVAFVSSVQKTTPIAAKNLESTVMDAGPLLGCIVRTIPPNGRIKISTTLPNRLSKMIAPLNWHDYEEFYGKLDDFVARHHELFIIEGDYIKLREGAQKIIAAAEAYAKVAAASATSSYSSVLPSVAVTPMAQSLRSKKAPSMDSESSNQTLIRDHPNSRPRNGADHASQISAMQNQHSSGMPFVTGVSGLNILSKHKEQVEVNGTETTPDQLAMHLEVRNGAVMDRSGLGSQNKGAVKGRTNTNFGTKQQDRITTTSSSSRK